LKLKGKREAENAEKKKDVEPTPPKVPKPSTVNEEEQQCKVDDEVDQWDEFNVEELRASLKKERKPKDKLLSLI